MSTAPMNTEPTLPLPDPDIADLTPSLTPVDAVASPDSAASTEPSLTPRTRWAAIVWGVFFASVACAGIWILTSSARRDDVTDWFAGLTPGTITAVSLLSLGALVLVAGLVGLIRRVQRAARPNQP